MTATTLTAQGGDVGTLAAPDGINAAVSAHGSIAALRPGAGNLAGSFTALTGSLPDITCDGSITAALTAGTTIGNLTASQNIAATVFATGSIGEIVTRIGNISGNITSQNGNIGKVIAGNDLSANITAIAGGIGDLIAGHNLAGNMSAHTSIGDVIVNGTISGYLQTALGPIGAIIAVGDITNFIAAGNGDVNVWTFGNAAGSITASSNVTLFAAGTVSGNVLTTYGNVFISAGGDITSQTVRAACNIALAAGGNIAIGQIIASGDISVGAGGNIAAPDVISTETGIVSEAAGGQLTTNATSSVDVWLSCAAMQGTACMAGEVTNLNAGGDACFVAGTPVLMADRSHCPIEALKRGMAILAVPEDDPTATPVARRIIQVFHRPPTRIFEVQVEGHTLRTTARHRFYVRHRGWVEASSLLPGDQLQTPTGQFLKVTSVKETNDFEPVFNFEVDRDHTYFVALDKTGSAVLVHNDMYIISDMIGVGLDGITYRTITYKDDVSGMMAQVKTPVPQNPDVPNSTSPRVAEPAPPAYYRQPTFGTFNPGTGNAASKLTDEAAGALRWVGMPGGMGSIEFLDRHYGRPLRTSSLSPGAPGYSAEVEFGYGYGAEPLHLFVPDPGAAGFVPVVGPLWSAAYEYSRGNPKTAALMLLFAGFDAVTLGAAAPERAAVQGAARAAVEKEAALALEKKVGTLLFKIEGETVELDTQLVKELCEQGCFAPGTLVATETGQRPIETIQEGERVWAYDVSGKQWCLQKVLQPLSLDYVGKLVTVRTEAGELTCTPAHPFWVVEGSDLPGRPTPEDIPLHERVAFPTGRWVSASDVQPGDILLTKTQGTVTVQQVFTKIVNSRVHNLVVDRLHTFAAGVQQIVVHNKNVQRCVEVLEGAKREVQSFSSFDALKRALGPAGEGKAWHHIVEQSQQARFGAQAIHNTENVIAISAEANSKLNALYSSIRPEITGSTTLTVRQWLSTKSFEDCFEFGKKAIQNVLSGRWP